MSAPRTPKVLYGGDYNPEQWTPDVWEVDYAAFDQARIDTLTLGVFTWSLLQPDEQTYDFTALDAAVERAVAGGRKIVLATATGAMPPWLGHQYPEVNRVDFEGRRHTYGQRHNHCPSSPVFQRLSAALADRIAERYTGTPGLVAWHVGNEYGGPDGSCYCENCAAAYREWLMERYGSLDALNEAWNTTFWSHRYTDVAQIQVPNALSEHWKGPHHTAFQGNTLDYRRFMSEALLANYRAEKMRIRAHDPHTPVTTNFMGAFRPLDYHRWSEELDFASWDNYPPGRDQHVRMAFTHDLMRGLKGGEPFWVMEQTPTMTASRGVNPVKRPGVLGLWSWQGIAHGADAMLYFQMRASRGACEKFHGAVLDHAGRTDSRPFREIASLGEQLEQLGEAVIGARTPAKVALIFDWDNWWTTEITDGLNRNVSYLATVLRYYGAVWAAGADVDVVPMTADLTGYDVVLAPLLHLLKDDVAERLHAVAARGGTVVTSFWAGRVDESTNAYPMDAPGPLAPTFGIRVEEIDSAEPGVTNPVTLTLDAGPVVSPADQVMELIVPAGAEIVGTYGSDFYTGTPAVTRHRVGEGAGWYIGAGLDESGLGAIVRQILGGYDLVGPYAGRLEHAVRERDVDGRVVRTHFLLNHGGEPVEVTAHLGGTDLLSGTQIAAGQSLRFEPTDVLVLREA
ncbi:beta-galactosidase [Ruania alkalisoli]|uniref:Beta-galactosidase n=1 Tax=Ruania alkalisoli TaxID=2779775 RepID=A0A7M1SV84_9MICO|nr:beta-galactosidase [Ruania alkalisoli]QOR71391.1 beta-galactosidase [Ruania alkalisoli]